MKNTTRRIGKNQSTARSSRRNPSYSYGRVAYNYYRSKRSSPRENSGDYETSRHENAPRKRTRSIIVAVTLLVVALFVLEIPVKYKPKIIVAAGAGKVSNNQVEAIQQASEQFLSSSVMNRTKLTFNKADLIQNLKNHFPRIKQLNVSFSLFSYTPTITVTFRDAALAISAGGGRLYLVDNEGVIVGGVKELSSHSKLIVVKDGGVTGLEVGRAVLPASYVGFVKDLSYQLDSAGLKVDSYTLKKESTEVDVKVKGLGYFIKFNLEGNSREEAGRFLASKKYLEKRGITPKNYLDARVPGRVYYK